MSETIRAKKVFLLLFFSLFMSNLTFAEHLSFKPYTTAEGLANDGVSKIVADSRGFLWFCTGEGLSRFDGYKFKNYTQEQGLPHRYVSDFLETKDGDYLIATPNGLAVFNPYGKVIRWNFIDRRLEQTSGEKPMFRTFFTNDSQNPNVSKAIFTLAQTANGNIYAGTNHGLFRVLKAAEDWKFEKVDFADWNVEPINFNHLLSDSEGNLWIATNRAIYLMTTDGNISKINSSGGNSVFEDRGGRVWVDSGGNDIGIRLYQFQNGNSAPDLIQTFTKKDGLIQNSFTNAVAQTVDGRIFVVSQARLMEFLPFAKEGEPKFRRFENEIDHAAADKNGNIWFEIPGRGAAKYTPNSFTVFDDRDGISKFHISSIFGNKKGEVFASLGYKEILGFVDGKLEKIVPFGMEDRLSGMTFIDFQASDGEWWIPTGKGLRRYPKVENFKDLSKTPPKEVYTAANNLKADTIFNLFEDSRGDVWITAAYTDTLHRWERASGKFFYYSPEQGLPSGSGAISFAEDVAGNLWFGFYYGQVMRLKGGKFRSFTDEGLIPRGTISHMLNDKQGRLWLATVSHGLFRVDNLNDETPVFTNISAANGLSGNQALCLTEDNFGRLYVGTGRGISRLEPETGRIKIYTTNDGLPGNAISNCYKDANGVLWFSSNYSLIRFVPQADKSSKPPPIFIDRISAGGAMQNISELGETELKNLEFASDERQIQISFFAISFDAGEVLRYQYKLGEQDWSAPSEARSIDFNLAAGNYQFAVRAVNSDGIVSETPAMVVFKINPPFWRTWWFQILAAALVCAVLYLLYLYRTKNLRRVNQALTETQIAEEKLLREREKRLAELERVRTRIATDLHDDIGSSLTQIAVLSEVARNQAAVLNSETVSMPLERIKGVSRELVETMSDVVWAINPNKDNLRDLVQRMRRFASDVCAGSNIHFELDAPPTENLQPLGANIRREVFAIFKESINNAVKYSECENIAADFRIENDTLFLEIKDDGRGFDTEETLSAEFSPEKGGNGLINMRRRASELGGNCRIISSVGGGTNIFLEVPLNLPEDDFAAPAQSGGENSNGRHL